MTGQASELDVRSVERPLLGQVAIVTGAAKGLGASISESFAAQGAHLTLLGRDEEALRAHGAKVDAAYGDRESLVVTCDVLDELAVQAMVQSTVDRFGRIDILVNTAGGTGPIVNIAGTSGLRGYKNRVGYSSSKWAVRGMTRTLALELGPYGITVNAVCPNVTHGDRMDKIMREKARKLGVTPEEVYADFASQTALGRFIDESDIASAVSFLVSEGARNITGQDIVVDAGWRI